MARKETPEVEEAERGDITVRRRHGTIAPGSLPHHLLRGRPLPIRPHHFRRTLHRSNQRHRVQFEPGALHRIRCRPGRFRTRLLRRLPPR